VDETLEWLYQVSLGKAPFNDEIESYIRSLGHEAGMAASHAIVLAELRQDLALAEVESDTMTVTTAKRKVELVEERMLLLFERLTETSK